jgi:hypothetical protein
MSNSISTLMLRNLRDVFGENDPVRRRAAIDEIYNEDCVFYDPNTGAHRGREEVDRIAGAIKATHPDFQCGRRVPLARSQPTRGLISSSLGTAGFPPSISFSTVLAIPLDRMALQISCNS